jgi:hypothetical protein
LFFVSAHLLSALAVTACFVKALPHVDNGPIVINMFKVVLAASAGNNFEVLRLWTTYPQGTICG